MTGEFHRLHVEHGARAVRALCIAGVLCLATGPARAQTAEGTDGAAGSRPSTRADGATVLDTISVTATRNPIESFEYPGMVTVVGPRELRARQPSTADEALRFVPGVEFTGGPRRTGETPRIRGFQGADVIVTIDGARQNFGSTHDGRFFIDPSLLERVEVLRGPASSLYGSGGTGGLIEFRTADAASLLGPGEKAGVTVSGGYQSVNSERTGNFTAYGVPGEGIDLVGSVTKRDSGAIELGDGNELKNTDDDIVAGLAKAGFAFAGHHRVEGAFIGFRNNAREPNNGQEGIDDGQTAVGLVDKRIRTQTFRAAYGYHNPGDDLLDLDLVAWRTDFRADELRLERVDSGPAGELLKRDVDTVGLRLDNRSRAAFSDSAVTFTYGLEFWRDRQDGADRGSRPDRSGREMADPNGTRRDGVPDARARFAGVFAQAEVTVSDPFGAGSGDVLIIPGARYDDYAISSSDRLAGDNEDNELSPRIGLTWLPSDRLMLFTNYAHAFRAPTVNEIYLTGTHFPVFRGRDLVGFNRFEPNPDLEPQRTRTIEFGAGVTFDDVIEARDHLRLKATHFRISGKNFIDLGVRQESPRNCIPFTSDRRRIPAGPPGSFLMGCEGATFSTNVPDAKLRGTEIEASYESSRLLTTFGFSTIDGEDEDTGRKLGALTPNRLTVDVGLKLPGIDSIAGWRMLAAGRFDKVNDPEDERAGYAVHDVYLSWQPSRGPLGGLRISLGVDNVFDKGYTRVDTNAAEPGRGFKATAGWSITW